MTTDALQTTIDTLSTTLTQRDERLETSDAGDDREALRPIERYRDGHVVSIQLALERESAHRA